MPVKNKLPNTTEIAAIRKYLVDNGMKAADAARLAVMTFTRAQIADRIIAQLKTSPRKKTGIIGRLFK